MLRRVAKIYTAGILRGKMMRKRERQDVFAAKFLAAGVVLRIGRLGDAAMRTQPPSMPHTHFAGGLPPMPGTSRKKKVGALVCPFVRPFVRPAILSYPILSGESCWLVVLWDKRANTRSK